MKKESIILGGGCFWCTEAVMAELKGVLSALPGYAGGHTENPTYEQVCSGTTNHAEVVKVEFDPKTISLNDILEVFFATHDPTTPNQQGNDVGTQYRSAIYYTSDGQKAVIDKFIQRLADNQVYKSKIVTEIKPLDKFFEAEQYHHEYYKKNPDQGYCQTVINPKLKKFREKYSQLLNEK